MCNTFGCKFMDFLYVSLYLCCGRHTDRVVSYSTQGHSNGSNLSTQYFRELSMSLRLLLFVDVDDNFVVVVVFRCSLIFSNYWRVKRMLSELTCLKFQWLKLLSYRFSYKKRQQNPALIINNNNNKNKALNTFHTDDINWMSSALE